VNVSFEEEEGFLQINILYEERF